MRIAIDATYSVGRQLTGVGVYSRELANGLAAARPGGWIWCYRPHRFRRGLEETPPSGVVRRPLFDFWPPRCDLFHGLNQRLPARARWRRSVVTFHDLFVLTAEYSTPEFRARFAGQAREAAARADRVIAVSAFTAAQVHQLLGVDQARIHVVPHGVRTPAPSAQAAREPLILFTGAIQARKNVERLVAAFERLPKGWKLVLAGSAGYGAEAIMRRIEASPRGPDIQTPGWVSDAELEALLSRASIFAFPSLDEGFGMPVLDAMARGIPVLTSNRSAMPEVSGGACIEVDPLDVDAIAAGLLRLISDPEERTRVGAAGVQRAKLFSWERAVRETMEVYRQAAQ